MRSWMFALVVGLNWILRLMTRQKYIIQKKIGFIRVKIQHLKWYQNRERKELNKIIESLEWSINKRRDITYGKEKRRL